jgi:hypothetical protein
MDTVDVVGLTIITNDADDEVDSDAPLHDSATAHPDPADPGPEPVRSAAALDCAALDCAALDHAALDHAALDCAALDHAALDHAALDHAAPDDVEPDDGLTERERQVLAFERQWWRHAGSKEQAIRDQFDVSSTRYYQMLNRLLDNPAALAHDPVLVKRLRRLRATRTRARTGGRVR